MTATAVAARAQPTRAESKPGAPLLVAGELALTGYTLAVVVGFARIFDKWAFFGPLALAAAAAHLLAIAARRLRLSLVASSVLSLFGLVVLGAVLFYASTTNHGIPTATTWDAFASQLTDAWHRFDHVVAPVSSDGGELVAAFIAVWVASHLADAFAFRGGALVESLVPGGLLFIFCSALAADRHRLVSAALALGAGLVFALVFSADRRSASGSWLATDERSATSALLAGGSMLVLGAVFTGLLFGPAIPGARDAALIDLQGTGGNPARVTLSPLVDIRGRLSDKSDVEVFAVRADRPSYWRLTSLDIFDGKIWRSEINYHKAKGNLPSKPAQNVVLRQLNQQFTIEALGGIWLPAALTPAFESGGDKVSFDPGSSTLITGDSTPNGMRYLVASSLPEISAAALQKASDPPPSSIAKRYLQLPADFPDSLRQQAAAIAGTAATPFEKAITLQNYFRTNFQYDPNVLLGHSSSAIEAFLALKAGYCEQFAGSYAALARALGLPARVAVGFTPGSLGSDGQYHVLDRHAHAWPEVYFTGIGWVPFEPTPGRGDAGSASYTGVPAAQAGDFSGPSVSTSSTTSTGSTTPNTGGKGPRDPTSFPSLPNSGANGGAKGTSAPSPWPGRILYGAIWVLAAAVLWPVALGTVRRQRRRRRWMAAGTDRERVLAAWDDAVERVGVAGVRPGLGETRREFTRRVQARLGIAAAPLAALADAADTAGFAGEPVDGSAVTGARAVVEQIRAAVKEKVAWMERVRWLLDPRTIDRAPTRGRQGGVRFAR
jgi:hypothetical protein